MGAQTRIYHASSNFTVYPLSENEIDIDELIMLVRTLHNRKPWVAKNAWTGELSTQIVVMVDEIKEVDPPYHRKVRLLILHEFSLIPTRMTAYEKYVDRMMRDLAIALKGRTIRVDSSVAYRRSERYAYPATL